MSLHSKALWKMMKNNPVKNQYIISRRGNLPFLSGEDT